MKMGNQQHGKRIAIFGATSTIAAEIAAIYAAEGEGARVFLAGRDRAKLERVAARLGPALAGSVALDLVPPEQAAAAVRAAIDTLGVIDIAVIAHGLLGDQLATERDYAAAERVLQTNLLSPVALLIPLANHMEANGRGQLAVLSSVAGERGRPRNYTYGAAKGALNVYLQGLRSRLWSKRIGVHALKLGPVDTPMTVDHPKTIVFARADRVARDIVSAIRRNRPEAYVPWFWRPIMAVVRRLPESIFQRFSFLSGR